LVSIAVCPVCLYSFRNGTACWKDEASGRCEVEPMAEDGGLDENYVKKDLGLR